MSVKVYSYTPVGTEPSGTPTTTSFSYNTSKPDVLTKFGTTNIGSDRNGALTSYIRNYTWSNGKLAKFTRGSKTMPGGIYEECNYTYNGYGQRTSKAYVYDPNPAVSNDASFNYTTTYKYDHSGRLINEKIVEAHNLNGNSTRELTYVYDASGVVGFTYSIDGATAQAYYYQRNLQGDVIAIYDTNGAKVVEYAYDAWGNCTIVHSTNDTLANDNPIRYRGYYFDIENNFYYLNSRYYSPELKRFVSPANVSALNPQTVNGLNLYVYAVNNPINIRYNSLSTTGGMFGGGIVNSIESSVIMGRNMSTSSISLPQLPKWTKYASTALEVFSSFAGVFETSIWAITSSGKAFSDFHYAAYGINRFTILDELTSPLGKICNTISVGLIFADLGINIYNSIQQEYTFTQGVTSFTFTAVKDIGIYYASAKVASAVGGYIAGSKLGAALGSWAGPAGMILGAAVGFTVGYVIDEFGDVIIDWIVDLLD